jgi:hypothetical protein
MSSTIEQSSALGPDAHLLLPSHAEVELGIGAIMGGYRDSQTDGSGYCPDLIQQTTALAFLRAERARFMSMRTGMELAIHTSFGPRVRPTIDDMPTGAYIPFADPQGGLRDMSPQEVQELANQGVQAQLLDIRCDFIDNTRRFGEPMGYSLEQVSVLKAALRHAYATTVDDVDRRRIQEITEYRMYDDVLDDFVAGTAAQAGQPPVIEMQMSEPFETQARIARREVSDGAQRIVQAAQGLGRAVTLACYRNNFGWM